MVESDEDSCWLSVLYPTPAPDVVAVVSFNYSHGEFVMEILFSSLGAFLFFVATHGMGGEEGQVGAERWACEGFVSMKTRCSFDVGSNKFNAIDRKSIPPYCCKCNIQHNMRRHMWCYDIYHHMI